MDPKIANAYLKQKHRTGLTDASVYLGIIASAKVFVVYLLINLTMPVNI